jgi:hypothetical protein
VWIRVARWVAVAIAVLAVIDPAVTTARRTEAMVAVVAVQPGDSGLARRVAAEIEDDFVIVRGPLPVAAATVLAGSGPAGAWASGPAAGLAPRVFVVMPDAPERALSIPHVEAPASAALNARVTVNVTIGARGIAGRDVDVSLRAGDVALDRVQLRAPASGDAADVALSFVPDRTGPVALVVAVEAADVATVERSAAVHVRDERLDILFFDGRPAWLSTFVRRAVEQDVRFNVTSRVATSRGIATAAGQPPAGLGNAAALRAYDAIVVGAPETLTSADVAGLEAYMRRRGGSVVLLLDRRASGPFERLTGASGWSAAELDSPARIDGAAAGVAGLALEAAELVVPVRLPAGATAVAAQVGTGAPAVWRSAVGGGRLIVSGAADAWRFRDPELSDFDAFWTSVIGDVAAAAPPALELTVAGGAAVAHVTPGEYVDAELAFRDVLLADAAGGDITLAARAALDGETVRFWPDARPGRFTARVRAPARPGTYELVASTGAGSSEGSGGPDGANAADGNVARTWLVVTDVAVAGAAADAAVVGAWATSRGGSALTESELSELPGLLRDRIAADRRREPWHPMRSAWWIVPFATLLGVEWLWRRRRGLA